MTELATVQNLSDGPVLIDPEGHSLGAGESGPVAIRTEHVRSLVRAGLIAVVDRPAEGTRVDPSTAAAFQATDELRQAEADAAKDADAPKGRKATTTTAQEG